MKNFDFVCFGGEDWWYHNRGHIDMQLMRRFARLGTTLYINSIVMQKPKLAQGRRFARNLTRKVKSILKGLQKSDAGFWVYSPFSLPVHHIAWLRSVNKIILQWQLWWVMRKLDIRSPIIWVACPVACDVVVNLNKTKLVYQRTDRFEEYPNIDAHMISQYDQRLKVAADLIVYVNSDLYKEEANGSEKSIYLDHGVDYDLFATAENNPELPDDMKDIKHPIVGFFGGIDDHTMDVKFLEEVITLLPEMNFVLVGKASVDCSGLKSQKNVWLLGQKPYVQIPHYGKCFDVAIMPWRQNRWIQACNPIKLKEYLALGKPIVSTPFPELRKYLDIVYVGETPEKFAKHIRKALKEDNRQRIMSRRKEVESVSWGSKSRLVMEKLLETNFPNLERICHA